jgi:hypothetical protein
MADPTLPHDATVRRGWGTRSRRLNGNVFSPSSGFVGRAVCFGAVGEGLAGNSAPLRY